jgi:hypothetical protein
MIVIGAGAFGRKEAKQDLSKEVTQEVRFER